MPTPLDRSGWTYLAGINGTGAFPNSIDADLGTNWNNGGGFQAIGSVYGIDMGAIVAFGSLSVWQNAPEWKIEVSDDASTWVELVASQFGGGSDTPVQTDVDFGAEITGRYLRFTLLDTDSYHYKIWEIYLYEYEPPPPPPPVAPGTRQYQEDFETVSHGVNGTSTTRRPDAVSLDYQIAYSYGPVALEDISQGVEAFAWYVRVEGQVLYICRENDARDDWGPEEVLHDFAYSGPSLMDEIDFCFDLAGKPVVVAERTSGNSDTTPEVWIYRYDPPFGDYLLGAFGPGRTPRCVLDLFPESPDPDVCPPDVNVQVLYFEPDEFLTRLQQDDLFAVKYVTEVATLPTRYLEELFPTDGRRLGAYWVEHNELAGTYAENIHWSLPYPDGALHEPVFEGVTFDLVWLRGEPWRNPSGSTTTDVYFWRVKTRDPCDAIEIQCANTFPSGFQPHTGGIWTEQVTDSIAEGYPSLDAEDFVDFNITVDHGFGTMTPIAFRARTRKTVASVTCYSPWRYYFAAQEAITGQFTDPLHQLHNCDRDATVCWAPVIAPWYYEHGFDDRGCHPCDDNPVCDASFCAPDGFFVGGWQPDSPFL
jgi:F5/8 type C domain-containing protein